MKLWIYMSVLLFAVAGLCVWDGVHTNNVFNYLNTESSRIHDSLIEEKELTTSIVDDIWSLNDYWTKKMDTLCVSISRKDLQPISDYLQYLCASTINDSVDDAITYSSLLKYNVTGLKECTGFDILNLL